MSSVRVFPFFLFYFFNMSSRGNVWEPLVHMSSCDIDDNLVLFDNFCWHVWQGQNLRSGEISCL